MLNFIIAFIIVLADQAAKYFTTKLIGPGGQMDVLPGIVRLTYVQNTGSAFSMFSDQTFILTIVSGVAVLALILILIFAKMGKFGKLSLAFILGGAIGNLIDRAAIGYVVDMIEPTFINFAVFNVADIFVTVGAIFLILYILFGWKPSKKAAKEEPTAGQVIDGPAPYSPIDHAPRNAKERRAVRRAKKYGPDIDESTVTIPVKEVQKAIAEAEAEPDEPVPEAFPDINTFYNMPPKKPSSVKVSVSQKSSSEFSDVVSDASSTAPTTAPSFEGTPATDTKLPEPDFNFDSSFDDNNDSSSSTLDDILKKYGF